MRRLDFASLIAAAALLATPAHAQFQPVVMKLPAWFGAEVAPGRWHGAAGGDDLLVLRGSGAPLSSLVYWRDLLAFEPWTFATPATATLTTVGPFDGASTATSPDVVWAILRDLSITWGSSPTTRQTFIQALPRTPHGIGSARLLPLPRTAPLLVASFGDLPELQNEICLLDLAAVRTTAPAAPPRLCLPLTLTFPSAEDGEMTIDRIHPIRLSPGAIANGVDDVVIPIQYGFRLLWNATPASATTFAELNVTQLTIGSYDSIVLGTLLPPGVPGGGSCLGAAAVDVDGDGDRDLVFSYSDEMALRNEPGFLLWIENTGDPIALQTAPWTDLTARADLAPLLDPGTLRQLDLAGEPIVVVEDRGLDQFLVIRGGGTPGFTVQRLPTFGASARDFKIADVVGSQAPDLIARVVTAAGAHEVWVYPDEGDMATLLSWNPALPAVALAGFELTLGVNALDPDQPATPFAIDWYLAGVPAPVATGGAWTATAAEVCGPATTLGLTVRALDSLGVYTELAASIPIEWRPSLALVGSSPPGRLVVPPGGVAGRVEASAWPACGGAPAFTWGESSLAGVVQTGAGSAGSSAWREFDIPESAYPELLDGAAGITLRAVDTGRDGTTTLPLLVDARGLVEATVEFDRAALAPGELGTARVRLASRISVPLPRVRVLVRLAGLAFAGAFRVTGAPATLGPEEGEVVVDPLPASAAAVEIVVPVRALGAPGAVSVELFSEGGDRVSPEASPDAGDGRLPGCSCGSGGDLPVTAILLLLMFPLLKPTRRRLS